jgi:hypothetical protein
MSKLQQIRQAIESGDFDRAKDILASSNNTISSFSLDTQPEQPQPKDTLNINKTRGVVGRINDGMQFLELITLTFSGKDENSVLKFDKLPRFVNPFFFRMENTDEVKINLIRLSLGIDSYIQEISDREFINSINEECLKVYDDVTSGTFRIQNNRRILILSRALARRVL